MTEESKPELKKINFESGKMEVGDHTFYIQTSLSTSRYVEYLKRVPRLAFHTTFKGMYETLSKIYYAASSGNDIIYAIQQARELSWNQLDAIRRFDEHDIPDIIDFCALFLNRAGEDVGVYDDAIHEEKKAMLVQGGYDIADFFTLAFAAIESLQDAYHKIIKAASVAGMQDIRLSPQSPKDSHTF